MNKSVEFELNMAGLNELMKSDAMQAHLRQAAAQVAQSAGPEYGNDIHTGSWTAIATVFPNSPEANRDNLDNNTLTKVTQASGLQWMEKKSL